MFRTSDMVLIAVMVGAAAFTYKTKHDAEDRLEEVRRLESQIRYEEESIDVLKADWSILTQPARLQKLSETYQAELQLQPVEARQIVKMSEVPERPPVIVDPTDKPETELAGDAAKTDSTRTGAIAQ